MTDNPILNFTVEPDELSYIGEDLQRPECILANELEIPYAAVALSTDYDCWKTDEEPVTWEEVIKVFNRNVENVLRLLLKTIGSFSK